MVELAAIAVPSVRTRSKSHHSAQSDERALHAMAFAWRDTPIWIPVVHGRRIIGEVRGDPARGRTLIRCTQDVPYNDYDIAVAKKSTGKHYAVYWTKTLDSTAVIDSWYDLWSVTGNPQPGDFSGTNLTARVFTNATPGALNCGPSVSPFTKYLTRTSGYSGGSVQAALIYDRVLSYEGCQPTIASQNFTNTLPATRYISTGDPGLQIFPCHTNTHPATASTLNTLTYVNQGGTGGHTVVTSPALLKIVSQPAPVATLGARGLFQTPGAATKNANPYLTLQSGDQGVRSLTNFAWSSNITAQHAFVLQFPIALFADMATPGQCFDADFIYGLEAVNKRVYDDACLSVLYNTHVATLGAMHGWSEFGWT